MAPHAEALRVKSQVSSSGKMATSKLSNQSNGVQNGLRIEGTSDTTGAMVPDPVLQTHPTTTRFTHNDVLPLRSKATKPMAQGVAPFSSAELFKSPSALAKPNASKSYLCHLTAEAKARTPSSLKGAMKYFNPSTISLCGGLPSSQYFPFEELAFEVPTPATDFSATEGTKVLRGRKHDIQEGKSMFDLSVALNYGQSMGPPQLMRFLTEHTEIVHNPPYSNWEICMTQGSTSALDISLRMFCSRGDALLTEEYSFSSAIETAIPMGLKPVGIKMDGKGLCPKDLKYVLSNWDQGDCLGSKKYGGAKRPTFLYTVPTGQNPTGATQDLERRKTILQVCEEYNVFILEDEPYYFLQMEQYVSRMKQANSVSNGHCVNGNASQAKKKDLAEFINTLIPSYLSLSTTGNILRMDSFSKILAPGSRTGWVTGPADIIERFVRASEVSAQNPSGFSMVALFKLLEEEWGHKGFLQWLQNLRAEYTWRRDGIVEACEAYLPSDIVQFEAPTAGMFHWLRIDGSKHPLWHERAAECQTETQTRALLESIEEKIFLTATEFDVLMARGSWFRAEKKNDQINATATATISAQNGHTANGHQEEKEKDATIYFRMTFAAAPMDKITEAVKRFGNALRSDFRL